MQYLKLPVRISARCGKIVDVHVPYNFKTLAVLVVEKENGTRQRVFIKMAEIRRFADNLIGHNCQSMTRIRETFIDYALDKCYVAYTEYEGYCGRRQTIRQTAWCIL